MTAQMRNVFQERDFVSQRNVVEQNKVLMQLPHVPYVGELSKRGISSQES